MNAIVCAKRTRFCLRPLLLPGLLAPVLLLSGCGKSETQSMTDNSYNLGTTIRFGSGGGSERFRKSGWSDTEREFTWTTGRVSKLEFSIAPSAGPLVLKMRLLGLTKAPELPFQPVELDVNGQKIAEWNVGGAPANYTAMIPGEISKGSSELNIELKIPKATTPQSLGMGADSRVLGICCWEMVISKLQ